MGGFLESLEWRHASKAFDPDRGVSSDDLEKILYAIRLAPTSFGLQPFRVWVVTDAAAKKQIMAAAWNQKQVAQASHVLVFTTLGDLQLRTTQFMEEASGGDAAVRQRMGGYEKVIRGFLGSLAEEEHRHWSHKQAYMALGFAMAACAELRIDSCPLEGFMPDKVDALLNLPEDEVSCVLLALGHRTADFQAGPKIRFPESDLFVYPDASGD